ncbi:MAG: ethanolamine utilization protein EutH [Clostridia bacterium]|nr:ethanolamine utilization protein EutH [Clostridia bacterium]
MNVLTIIILIFAMLGLVDKLLGNKFGLGKEFEKGFALFAPMVFSMLGMLVIAPAIGVWLTPFFDWFYSVFKIDPSVIPASLFANDMGGMTLAQSICKSETIGNFNAFVVSSMLGCVVSFTIPFAIGIVKKEQHKELFFGLLCGITTVPIGCLVGGLLCGIGIVDLVISLLPLIVFAVVLGAALILLPNFCIKAFVVFGHIIRWVAMIGLACSIFTFLTKIPVYEHFDSFENAAFICANACVTLSGALPLMFVVSKLLNKPLSKVGSKIGIDSFSAFSFLSTLVTNATTFSCMEKMNKKGVVLNSAFAVSAAFVFGSHMAFTLAFNADYIMPVIVGKLVSGVAAVVLAMLIYKEDKTTA